jgi:predicted nucleotidyltransferase
MDILKYFFEEPEREFHVREIAKLVKKSPTTVSKLLKEFVREKILVSEKKFNHLLFKANNEDGGFKRLKLNYNLNRLYDSGLVDCLVEKLNYPEAIILFGSYAKAENISRSDIDLFVVSPVKRDIDLQKFEEKLGHEIQIFVHSKKEIEKMKKSNKGLLNNIINGYVIYGYWGVFE